jgi:non-specific serine/threonine protein kinase
VEKSSPSAGRTPTISCFWETERSLLLAGALWPFWYVHGPYQEGRDWVEQALAQNGNASPLARGRAVFALGQLAVMQGDVERAAVCFEECLVVARAGGFTLGATGSLMGLASVAMLRGDFARAEELVEEALELIWQTDDPRVAEVNAGLFLSHLGSVAYARGNLELASARFTEALSRQRTTVHRWGEAFSLTGLGYVARAQGDDRLARTHFGAGLPLFDEHEDWRMIALTLAGVAGLAATGGQPQQAARLFAAAAALRQTGEFVADPAYQATNERDLGAVRATLGESAFVTAWSEGQAMTLEEALALATAMLDAPIATPQPAPVATRYGLTPRELEVLRLVVAGQTDREIAEMLFISRRTAQGHVAGILAKLDVHSRGAAVATALRAGVVAPDGAPPS